MRSFSVLAGLALVVLIAGTGSSFGAAGGGPSLISTPAAVGASVVGQRLTGEPGTWSGSGAVTYGYQWHRCDATGAKCGSISGATAPSYKLVAKDVEQTIGLTVTATDPGGTTSAYSSLIGPIAAANAPLISTVQPTISGTPSLGQSLQVSDGAWSPKPTQVSYAWQRCDQTGRLCTPISNATTSSYTIASNDAGHALVVLLTATSGATSEVTLSAAASVSATTTTTTTTAGTGPTETAAPAVAGTAAVGERLTAGFGTWSGPGTLSYGYQWHRCDATGAKCSSIHGATAASYKLAAKDAGQTIGLTVTATDSAGKTSGYAALIGPIAASATSPLIATTQPGISGTAKVGQVLLTSNGVWTSAPTSYTYAWQRCNSNGRICTPIAGATKNTYTLTAADSGHAIAAIVQAVIGTTTQSAFSTATAVVN